MSYGQKQAAGAARNMIRLVHNAAPLSASDAFISYILVRWQSPRRIESGPVCNASFFNLPMYNSESHFTARRIVLMCAIVILCIFIAMIPSLSSAQSSDTASLVTTIRAAIKNDPRSSALPAAQVDSMVQALAAKAQAQGLTAQDIAYLPNGIGVVVPAGDVAPPQFADPCAGSTACSVGRYLSSGVARNPLYVILWVISFFLAIILWHERKHFHLHDLSVKKEIPAIGGKA